MAPGGTFENPPEGAILHYFLKKPAGEVTLEILDEKGDRVRKLTSKKEEEEEKDVGEEGDYEKKKKEKEPLPVGAGLHRVVWDLRYEGPERIKKAKVDGGDLKTGPLVDAGDLHGQADGGRQDGDDEDRGETGPAAEGPSAMATLRRRSGRRCKSATM